MFKSELKQSYNDKLYDFFLKKKGKKINMSKKKIYHSFIYLINYFIFKVKNKNLSYTKLYKKKYNIITNQGE